MDTCQQTPREDPPSGREHVPGKTLARLTDLRERRRDAPWCKPTVRTVTYLESDVITWVMSSRQVDSRSLNQRVTSARAHSPTRAHEAMLIASP